jgi:hypothetical protein
VEGRINDNFIKSDAILWMLPAWLYKQLKNTEVGNVLI